MRPLSGDSSRLIGAQRFGIVLRKAMSRKSVGAVRLAKALGCSSASIGYYRAGRNIPTVTMAERLADILDTPELVKIARAARTIACDQCGREFPVEQGSPKRFCSPECRRVHGKLTTGDVANTRLRAVTAERSLRVHQDLVLVMCQTCEPEGICRTAECPLRPISPLSFREGGRPVSPIPEVRRHGPSWLIKVRESNGRRWTPEAREEFRLAMIARHAAKTPEQREAFRRAVSEGRRRGKAA